MRLASSHVCCELLGLDAFNEDHLYANLAWLADNQAAIESRLFETTYPDRKPSLFLYDVTSSYLEGRHNALGAFGYNRDGKHGKMQVVIGLLCDEQGRPLSIEVFAGNTLDPKTMTPQIHKVASRFGGGSVTFVGDRGMIKSPQIAELKLTAWIKAGQVEDRRQVELLIDEHERAEVAKLDGCYVIKTDLSAAHTDKETVHGRYKDLALVEQAFRTSKTVELEMRPIHVRLESSTRGHALVVMLAYRLVQELSRRWADLDLTVGDAIRQLETLCVTDIISGGRARCGCVPQPRPELARLIALADVELPAFITPHRTKAATKTKLPQSRVKRS